jgi:hypothetical protein
MSLSPHARAQIGRLIRLVVTTLAGSALVVNTIAAWEVRYPLLGIIVAGLEVAWRELFPAVPVPTSTAPEPPLSPASGGDGGR